MRAAWDEVETAQEAGLDAWKIMTDVPQAMLYEVRRIADAYHGAAPKTWSLLDSGTFELPCTDDGACGSDAPAGSCVKGHPDAANGFCRIGTCTVNMTALQIRRPLRYSSRRNNRALCGCLCHHREPLFRPRPRQEQPSAIPLVGLREIQRSPHDGQFQRRNRFVRFHGPIVAKFGEARALVQQSHLCGPL